MDISLPNISSGLSSKRNVVTQTFTHFAYAVGAFQQGHRQDDLGLLAEVPLQVTADEQIELLIRST